MTHCPMCPNHCSADALACGKGKRWLMAEKNPEMKEKLEKEASLREQFMDCAHILNYRKEKRHGQRRVLRVLKEHGSMTQRKLSEHFDIRPASLSELLLKLQDQGLIERVKLEEDRRNYQVSLTEKGMASLEEVKKEYHHHKDLFETLTDEEKQQFSIILKKLKESWSEGEDIPLRKYGHHHHHRKPESKHS